MSFHRKFWNVRTESVAIGYFEYTTIPYWPGNWPNPHASPGPPSVPSRSRSSPESTPVFTGAVKECGYCPSR